MEELKKEILEQISVALIGRANAEREADRKIEMMYIADNIHKYVKYFDVLQPIMEQEINRLERQEKWNNSKPVPVKFENVDIGYEVTPKIFEIKDKEREERE